MAEIILKIGDGANYKDGDVLAAFNRRAVRCVHAQHLCHPWDGAVNSDGYLVPGTHVESLYDITHEYKIERISQTEIRRTNRLTGEIVVLSNIPIEDPSRPGHMIACDVEEFFARRKQHRARNGAPKKAIFGNDGAEVLYDGTIDLSDAKIDLVWAAITQHTGRLETEQEFQLFPFGRQDIRSHLVVRTVDFTEAEAQGFVAPQIQRDASGNPVLDEDGDEIKIAERNVTIDWRTAILGDLSVTESQVLDRAFPVGVDLTMSGKLQHRSKDQPVQANRGKLRSKTTGAAP